MCGIAGFVDTTQRTTYDELQSIINAMELSLTHRGPDHGDSWIDAGAGVALGHRRLSIVDLTVGGHQPMHSADGRFVIVYNGEVYNFGILRTELQKQGYTFHSQSDTEVILAAIQAWGVETAIQRFIGMFAFVVWDKHQHKLYLVRDRVGIKPLYYGWVGDIFLFGSELKALRQHPHFSWQIDRDALALYFRYGYVPSPYSIYQGIRQLKPGQYLCFDFEAVPQSANPITYWSVQTVAQRGIDNSFAGSEQEALEQLEVLLLDAVKIRMIADVPLGAFLSGGIDSSLVVALMQAQNSSPVQTFTIGFSQEGYNEAEYARSVAQHLGTNHTELYVTPEDAMAVIPQLPTLYDEPFADSSQIPTYIVSRLARQQVTVSLSGDGGDELFAGYTSYTHALRIWHFVQRVPPPLRAAAGGARWLSVKQWNGLLRMARADLETVSGRRVHLASELIQAGTTRERLYQRLQSHWNGTTDIVIGAKASTTPSPFGADWLPTQDYVSWMQALDQVTYLPDDILVKLDRASMGVSLEARVPLLDHRIIEFAWTLPQEMKLRDNQGKWLLRQLLYKYVPQSLIERPKKGFSVPIREWLRGPLRDWAEDLLNNQWIVEQGFLNYPLIRQEWADFLSGKKDRERDFWILLMFHAWLETN